MTVQTNTNRSISVLWRLGDEWRDLRPEVLTSTTPIVFLTAGQTFRILHWAGGWQCRFPTNDAAYIAGDGLEVLLGEVEVATPCGLVTHGSTRDSDSRSMPLVMACSVEVSDLEDLLAVTLAAQDLWQVPRLGSGHPPMPCGALHCEVERELSEPE
ncbi:hypothetical protein KSP35_01760 [Aquihabitans sp. G128]|uniref:hypothetical protein n=1 Tax=Aquihabitans sp. G128 TaxID=2849779 RepID=UPI001C2142F1|nr:hypothetical protein [Aquihabitans sp. G128]QXC61600.1 hypothetical protein KSP35_01760 [Aquihabitans sp. G128]